MKKMIIYNSEKIITEEEIIYELVDNILSTEDKIKDIEYSIDNIDEKKGLGLKLINLKKEMNNNISSINDLKKEISEKEKKFNEYKIKNNSNIKKIENEIKEKEEKLNKILLNKNNEIYKISYEKIEKIINKKKDCDELKKIKKEINLNENIKKNLEKIINEKINEREEITEKLLMLREEKNNLNIQLINLISKKESIEELYKLYFYNLNNNINECNGGNQEKKFIKSNYKNNDLKINIFHFEISKINIYKCSNDISNILVKFIFSQNKEDNNKFNQEKISQIIKKDLNYIIQENLFNFIQIDLKKINSNKIEKFFLFLANQILNKIQIEIKIEKIINLIKYIFKVNYYEIIITNDINFINTDYKILKKENKKNLLEKQNEINKLINKKEEIEFLLNQINEKKIILEKTNNKLINLTSEERKYINLNEEISELNNNIKNICYEIEEKEQTLEILIKEKKEKINNINLNNRNLEKKIELVNKNIKKENEEKKKEIEKLKESIKEKFKMIKIQLMIYKKKHGNNLELYNKFVEKINNNLKIKNLLNNDSMLDNSSYMNIIMSPNKESKNNSLISNDSKTNFRNFKTLNLNYISSKSIFSPHKNISNHYSFKELRNNNIFYNNINNFNNDNNNTTFYNNNILINNFSNNYFTPIKSRNIDFSDKKIKGKEKRNISKEEKIKLIDSINSKKTEKKQNRSFSKIEINKRENLNNNILKYSTLIKTIICYYRIINNNNNKKFDPLVHKEKISEFNYEKISMKLNENFTDLNIYQNKNLLYQIPIKNIETTIVNNNIKYIIKIYQKYKYLKKKNGFVDMNKFIQLKDFNNIPFDYNNIKKAALNNFFNFQISFINNGNKERFEFVFFNYNDVKLWLNGLNFMIKNKNQVFQNLLFFRNFTKSK